MNTYLSCPTTVRSADLGHALVVVHEDTGAVITLLGSDRTMWLALADTGTPAGPGEIAPAAPSRLTELTDRGLLVPTERPRPWRVDVQVPPSVASWGTQEVPGALPTREPIQLRWVLPAALALATVFTVRAAGPRAHAFRRLRRLVALSGRAPRSASAVTTARVIDCVRVLGRCSPFRTACLEETVAAMLVLAVVGRRAGWCHGIAADPIRLHAWLAIDGHPVAEPSSTLRYHAMIQIPGPAMAGPDKGATP